MVWEAIFLLAVLKLPVIYVCCVVWWAIRSEPTPYDGLEPAAVLLPSETDPRPGARLARRPIGRGPHGRPLRTYRRETASSRSRVNR